ncbi:hypothetical protein M9Y10_040560 [Tritrichomonas musculus]|uniref:DUF3447 domain-containing protein n=1 Tax=Tritrichomonas musculus TaxID=1915356 RepID=A0ABR2GPZ4_9EUKA
MSIKQFLDELKEIHKNLLEYLDNESEMEVNFQILTKNFDNYNIRKDQHILKSLLRLLLNIANNHHRHPTFFNKIEKIILIFKDQIEQSFSNIEIYNIFKENKRILLFLIEEKILKLDEQIVDKLSFDEYFAPEVKSFKHETQNNLLENFEENRKKGENDDYICQLIQKDLIEEFITYVKKTNYDLSSNIKYSIYETNLLLNKTTTLIEYAAFFGSTQIFNYLRKNKVDLEESLWIYAIHGRNPEIIDILINESNLKINIEECLIESIKCHHNEILNYFQKNYSEKIYYVNNLISKILKYNYFDLLQEEYINRQSFHLLCKYDYYKMVKILLDNADIDVNELII